MNFNGVLNGQWELLNKLGEGTFGVVYKARHVVSQSVAAVKIERIKNSKGSLRHEYTVYNALNGPNMEATSGFPKIKFFGQFGQYDALVMELLGANLKDLFIRNNRKLSLKSVLNIGLQMTQRLEYMHRHGWIHCDIKPGNMMISLDPRRDSTLYLVDFGLSHYLWDRETRCHIPLKTIKGIIGPINYISINVHNRLQPSRRDDMESLVYVLVHLYNGHLPWMNCQDSSMESLFRTVGLMKKQLFPAELCSRMPLEISEYLQYCRNMKYNEKPDYCFLQRKLRGALKRLGAEGESSFEWISGA